MDVEVRIVRKGMLDSDDRVVQQLMLTGVPVMPGASQDLLLEWDGRVSTDITVTPSVTDRQLTDSSGRQPPAEIFKPDPELLPDQYAFPALYDVQRIIVKETGAGNVLFDTLVSGARFSVPQINYLDFTVDRDGVSGPDFDCDLNMIGALNDPDTGQPTRRQEVIDRILMYVQEDLEPVPGLPPLTVNQRYTLVQPPNEPFLKIDVGGSSGVNCRLGLARYGDFLNQVVHDELSGTPPDVFGIFPRSITLCFQQNSCFVSFFSAVSSSCEVAGTATAWPDAGDAFSRAVAVTITHENGHASGLVAPEDEALLEQRSPLNGDSDYHNQNPPQGTAFFMNEGLTWEEFVEGWCGGLPDSPATFLLSNHRYLLEVHPKTGSLR